MIEIGISTHAFAYNRLDQDIIGMIADAGFDAVEIYMHKPHFDFDDPGEVEKVIESIKANTLKVNSIHCPFYRQIEDAKLGKWLNITSDCEDLRRESVDWIKKSIRLAEEIDIDFAVIHFGDINDNEMTDEIWNNAYRSLIEINDLTNSLGVTLTLENINNVIATCEALNDFLNKYHLDQKIGICFDVGHAAIDGEIFSGIKSLKKNIKTVHLHDTIDYKDEHMCPGKGILRWRDILSELKSSGYGGRLILENKWGETPENTIEDAAEAAGWLQKLWNEV
jgi:protein FrlC